MGNWNINIQGIGSHHNEGNVADAQYMAARFVEDLKKVGHTIEHAEFTSGGKEDLTLENGHWTKKRA
jgi:hypothetical protein